MELEHTDDASIAAAALGAVHITDAQAAAGLTALRAFGLTEDDAVHVASGQPVYVTAEVQQRAAVEKAKVMADPAWVERYLAGGVKERELMMAINLRLGATVREG